jgi:2-amino-4-hydroxy-6-hydroxymethyldihydropteridine diphosphokinase
MTGAVCLHHRLHRHRRQPRRRPRQRAGRAGAPAAPARLHADGASRLYRTAPIDSSGDDYINAVARIATTLDAEALLQALQGIEQAHGRERPYRNAPRTLDLICCCMATPPSTAPR